MPDRPLTIEPRFRAPAKLVVACIACVVVGVLGLAGVFVLAPSDGWLWLLVNFLNYGAAATAMLGWAATFRTAQARWAAAVNRIGHSGIAFLPVFAVTAAALIAGVAHWAPWVGHVPHNKEAWYNVPFFVGRQIVALALLWGLALVLVRRSLRADATARAGRGIGHATHYGLNSVSAWYVVAYAFVLTLISYDFIMALSPEWVSTMFGAYFFTTALYMALAVMVVLAAAFRSPLGAEEYLKAQQFHDMGNLLLAFALLSMGFFFAQYLTIWYENLPEETPFLIVRYLKGPWPPVGWASLIIGYAVPFVVLQSRYVKRTPRLIAPVAGLGILGVMLERYVLVAASPYPSQTLIHPLGILSVLGFAGLFVLSMIWFLARYSPISSADEALRWIEREEAE